MPRTTVAQLKAEQDALATKVEAIASGMEQLIELMTQPKEEEPKAKAAKPKAVKPKDETIVHVGKADPFEASFEKLVKKAAKPKKAKASKPKAAAKPKAPATTTTKVVGSVIETSLQEELSRGNRDGTGRKLRFWSTDAGTGPHGTLYFADRSLGDLAGMTVTVVTAGEGLVQLDLVTKEDGTAKTTRKGRVNYKFESEDRSVLVYLNFPKGKSVKGFPEQVGVKLDPVA